MTDRQLLELMLDKMTGIGTDVRDVKGDLTELKSEVIDLKERVSRVEGEVTGLKEDVSELRARQDAIFEQTAGLIEFRFQTTRLLFEIKESQLSVANILGDHEIQIRTLKRQVAQSI